MDLNQVPLEVLESIFNKLDFNSLLQCRFVCQTWNQEIKSHLPMSLTINDSKKGNLKFINEVNIVKSLRVLGLRTDNYDRITNQKLARVQLLSFKFQYSSKPKLNLKMFGSMCVNLTCLKLHRPVLATCDFDMESGSCIQRRSLFQNLQRLTIKQVDDYTSRCDGQDILNTSKNITFLLETIGSTQLREIDIEINALYCDVNASLARANYRFENVILPQFICRQEHLEEIVVTIPIALPDWTRPVINLQLLSKRLKHVEIVNRIGIQAIIGDVFQEILSPELLQWDQNFYQNLSQPIHTCFWREFFLQQTQLETVCLQNHGHLGSADLISLLVQHSQSTIESCVVEALFTGIVDGTLMQNSRLKHLYISNYLFEPLHENGHGDCIFRNIRNLPNSLASLNFINVALDLNEITAVGQCATLKRFQLLYDLNHYMILEELPDYVQIMTLLLGQTHLDELILGMLEFDAAVDFGVEEWYDETDCLIIIR